MLFFKEARVIVDKGPIPMTYIELDFSSSRKTKERSLVIAIEPGAPASRLSTYLLGAVELIEAPDA